MSKLTLTAVLIASGLALAACKKQPEAPTNLGVCYHMAPQSDGTFKFNEVARNVPNIEQCAAQLEGMRIRFLRMGGQTREITGAYQSSFLFLRREGIFRAEAYNKTQYLMLMRTGDGRLAQPGAMPSE